MYLDRIYSISTERLEVGLSAIVGITAVAQQSAVQFLNVAGGTLLMSQSSTVDIYTNGARLITTKENCFPMRGQFYLAATGATCTVDVVRFLTSSTT